MRKKKLYRVVKAANCIWCGCVEERWGIEIIERSSGGFNLFVCGPCLRSAINEIYIKEAIEGKWRIK